MKRFLFLLSLFILLPSTSGCSHAVVPVVPVDTAPLVLPENVGPIVVLVDHLPKSDNFVKQRAEQVAIALRHFSAETSWGYVDSAPIEKVASAAAVVYLGLSGNHRLSLAARARLRRAHHLIVSEYHLASLRKAGIAFEHTEGGEDVAVPPNTTVSFKGETFPVALHDFLAFKVRAPAVVISSYNTSLPNRTEVPYIVQDGDALFVNGVIAFDSDAVTRRGAMLAVCDVMTRFLGAHPLPARPLAMLRLEDVSAITPAWRLKNFVHYLARVHVPYGIGVIPELRVQGRKIGPLRDRHELLNTLRWAEGHGATIILHGLHHCCSSEDAEGYEFWDHEHNAPVPNDSAEWMRSQVAKGLADLTALGLHPQMWETPHYSASPVDYKVVSQFFGAAWELRLPIGWLPWVLKRDQYGVMLLPEDLGYVSLDGTKTVADQLRRAKELLVCQSCVAAGFLHPSTVPIKDVREYVRGLQNLGYAFVDPAQALRRYSTLRTRGQISSASP
ncbi:MAG: DUF2334 domain-containing protein [Acidobacteriota bacterium]